MARIKAKTNSRVNELDDVFERFINIKISEGIAPKTLSNYTQGMQYFKQFFDFKGDEDVKDALENPEEFEIPENDIKFLTGLGVPEEDLRKKYKTGGNKNDSKK